VRDGLQREFAGGRGSVSSASSSSGEPDGARSAKEALALGFGALPERFSALRSAARRRLER
jgi:hypothetical protein